MILLIFALLGWIAGLVSGGSLRAISRYTIAGILLPVAAYLLKVSASQLLTPQKGAIVVSIFQYSLLFLFLLCNHQRIVWPLFAFFGTLFNFLVIVLNGGCMPVSASLLSSAGERLAQLAEGRIYAYCLMNDATRLPFLGDIIRIGSPDHPLGFASVGDLLLGIGAAILCWQMTRGTGRTEKNATESQRPD